MATVKVTDTSFETDVLKSSEPVLVDFWAEWCGPCRMIGPALEEISNDLGEKVTVAKLNIDENPEDRKSTRLNSSHANISYAVFCLKKKKKTTSLCANDRTQS